MRSDHANLNKSSGIFYAEEQALADGVADLSVNEWGYVYINHKYLDYLSQPNREYKFQESCASNVKFVTSQRPSATTLLNYWYQCTKKWLQM